MSRALGYIGVGLVVGVIGMVMFLNVTDDFEPDGFQLAVSLIITSVGLLLAQVGTIAWGVSVGIRELRDRQGGVPVAPAGGEVITSAAGVPSRTVTPPSRATGALGGLPAPEDRSPGWKDDPSAPGAQERWWDGSGWLEEVRAYDG